MIQTRVLEYKDYRQFLKDLYLEHKGRDLKYSFRKFATDLGFKPTNYLHLVISGKRNLSLEAVKTIQEHIEWGSQPKKYFGLLVQYSQTNSFEQKSKIFEELERILGHRRKTLKPEQYTFFSHWYIPVLKELIALKGFISNLNWISKKLKPRVPEEQVRQGLSVLEKLKLVEYKAGKWIESAEHLTTENEVNSQDLCKYHEVLLDLSKKALTYPGHIRDISAMTMSLSSRQFAYLKQRVIDFRNDIQQELQGMTEEEPHMVAQLNLQLFPVTE